MNELHIAPIEQNIAHITHMSILGYGLTFIANQHVGWIKATLPVEVGVTPGLATPAPIHFWKKVQKQQR